jgi:hypothetical protein
MTTSFTGSVKVGVTGTLTNSIDIGSVAQSINYSQNYSLANGTSANQANMVWLDTRTLTASSTEDLDLAGGLSDAFGNTVTFTRIKAIIISASSANTNNVVVGGDGTAAFVNWVSDATDKLVVRPGGTLCLVSPDSTAYAVTATTADILQVANSAGSTSVTYDIVLIGTV